MTLFVVRVRNEEYGLGHHQEAKENGGYIKTNPPPYAAKKPSRTQSMFLPKLKANVAPIYWSGQFIHGQFSIMKYIPYLYEHRPTSSDNFCQNTKMTLKAIELDYLVNVFTPKNEKCQVVCLKFMYIPKKIPMLSASIKILFI